MPNKEPASGTKEINIVHQNAIWRETIKKENNQKLLHTKFSINPHRLRKMHSITEKPNKSESQQHQQALTNVEKGGKEDAKAIMAVMAEDPEFLKVIDTAAMEPYKKFPYPMTEAQEYGWHHQPLIDCDPTDNRARKPRQNSEITKYMDAAWRLKEQTENLQ